jgi:hypothetical protein
MRKAGSWTQQPGSWPGRKKAGRRWQQQQQLRPTTATCASPLPESSHKPHLQPYSNAAASRRHFRKALGASQIKLDPNRRQLEPKPRRGCTRQLASTSKHQRRHGANLNPRAQHQLLCAAGEAQAHARSLRRPHHPAVLPTGVGSQLSSGHKLQPSTGTTAQAQGVHGCTGWRQQRHTRPEAGRVPASSRADSKQQASGNPWQALGHTSRRPAGTR